MSNPLTEPRACPTELDRAYVEEKMSDTGCKAVHESVLRSYQVLQLVKSLLEKKIDHEFILQIIELNYEE